jgi:hypothetical protein
MLGKIIPSGKSNSPCITKNVEASQTNRTKSHPLRSLRTEHDLKTTMSTETQIPFHGWFSLCSVIIFFVFYPATYVPKGPMSNGGVLGLALITASAILAWTGFVRNRQNQIVRWLVQLPIASLMTWFALRDGFMQSLLNEWFEY